MRYVLFAMNAHEKSIRDDQVWLGDFDSVQDAKSYLDSLTEETVPDDLSSFHEIYLYDKEVKAKFIYEWDGSSQDFYFEKILENA